jgi:hypothetical protein
MEQLSNDIAQIKNQDFAVQDRAYHKGQNWQN